MPAAPLDSMNGKKRIAAVRRKSSVVSEENIQERLGLRRQASTVRKSVILESLGKWETGGDLTFKQSPKIDSISETTRPRSFDDGPLVKEEMEGETLAKGNRAKSADARTSSVVSPIVPKQKTSKKAVGSMSPPVAPKRSSAPAKETETAAVSPLAPKRVSVSPKSSSPGLQKISSKRISPKRSSRKIKRASSRSILKDKGSPSNGDHLLEGDDDSKKPQTSASSGSGTGNSIGNGGSSVVSAPSKLPPNRAKRRTSKGPKSAKSMANGQKPRRSKSSDLEACSEGQTKAKKSKRRSKSADNDVDFGPDILVDEEKSEKSKKKGRTKRRSSNKRTSAIQSTDVENDKEGNQQSNPQDRRASLAGTKKRAHSAGPLKRKTGEANEKPALPERAASMMLNRDNTRRGKANSLHNLVQYSAEEIHSTSYFASNHVLVNRERMKRGLRPLTRNIAMDSLARESAESMAESAGSSPLRTTYVGNVLRGESIRAVHRAVMLNKQGRERANMLNPYFQDFGVGTAKGKDGMLYVCQLFSERLELSCTDLVVDEEKSD
ncbi:unnamed protein product [Cylindrotheca closterium]|uniref:SCP domain-containing protein n=1 Tax=Cylindrotheca closterium TaxID=2856 RepID=A0AAD2FMF8_9STRA|nr:unnamed protein product [Cylindrotheca closterium]